MKSIILLTSIMLISLTSLFLSGCGPGGDTFGQPITERKITRISDILAHPEQFDRKTVLLEGKIIEECPAGGWFMLKDDSGILLVNLHPSYFAIPQVVGHKAVAQGIVKRDGTRIEVVGKGVQLK